MLGDVLVSFHRDRRVGISATLRIDQKRITLGIVLAAFEMLGETGAELSPMATGYIAYFGTEATGMPNPVMMLVGVTGLLIAVLPLWFNTSD